MFRSRRYLLILGAGLVIDAIVAQTPLYQAMDRWLEDHVQAVTAQPIRFDDVLVIDIDEQSMLTLKDTLGAWPYPRSTYAKVVNYLRVQGARVIIFDILFAEPRQGDAALGQALGKVPDTWLAGRGLEAKLARSKDFYQRLDQYSWDVRIQANAHLWSDITLPTQAITQTAGSKTGVGLISILPDVDGVLRRFALLHEVNGRIFPSMPLAALFKPGQEPVMRGSPVAGWIAAGDRRWPVDSDGQVQIRVPRNTDFLPSIGFDRVLLAAAGHPQATLPGDRIRGRTIFIGSSAAVLGDYAQLPMHGRMAGLGVLALFYASLDHGLVLKPPLLAFNLLLILLAAGLPLLYTNRRACPEPIMALWSLLGLATALTTHVAAFGWAGQRSDILFALLAGLLVLAVQLSSRLRTLYEERRRLYYAKLAADEASEFKSRFLAHMTHELRTPLTAIMGYNRLLAESGINGEERLQQTHTIERNCEHLLALINNLLDQAKIEAGQMVVVPGPEDIRDLGEEVHNALLPAAADKKIVLRLLLADDLPERVNVDALRLKQIMYNLLANALKFTLAGDVTCSVSWAAQMLTIEVRDSGPGMASEVLSRIFEAFQQADATVAVRHGGTGLGLTITRNLVTLMGGHMRVVSSLGEGSTFSAIVPAPELENAAQELIVEAKHKNNTGTDFHDLRVLVVDDTVDIRELLSLYLHRCGIKAVLAENGQQAIDIVADHVFDVVLMDKEMPVMDGAEATQVLRGRGYQGIIIALTAHQDREQAEMLKQAGCDDVLEKPLGRSRLIEILEQVSLSKRAGAEDGRRAD